MKILDFGLITDLDDAAPPARVAGTPSYMAPEQTSGLAIGPAADFYAMGVMLHQALAGKLPARSGPTSPRALVPDVPEDLAQLCRICWREIPRRALRRARLRRGSAAEPRARRQRGERRRRPLVGREVELQRLGAALDEARAGRVVAALVRGSSGIGKSALVQRFVESLGDAPAILPLAGRCFQQESVPYKALDSVDRRARAAPRARGAGRDRGLDPGGRSRARARVPGAASGAGDRVGHAGRRGGERGRPAAPRLHRAPSAARARGHARARR